LPSLGIGLLLLSCDSDGGSDPPTTPQTLSYTFAADSVASRNSASIQVVTDGDGVRFRVVGTELTNLHSYDYEVRLPPLLRFTSGQADFGDMLTGGQSTGGATDTSFELATSLASTQPPVSGSGSLGSAGRYLLVTAGEGRVEFERALFRDGTGQPLAGLRLIGGTLRVIAR
jgi:hypothetical protein